MTKDPNNLLMLFQIQNYSRLQNFRPRYLVELIRSLKRHAVEQLQPERLDLKEPWESFLDVMDKFGHIWCARDQIKYLSGNKDVKNNPVGIKYHLYMLVYSQQAFFDTVAGLINKIYPLRIKKGRDIALDSDILISCLRRKHGTELVMEIDKLKPWLGEVRKYRDAIIHRHGIPVVPYGDDSHRPGDGIDGEHCRMPSNPRISYLDVLKGARFTSVRCIGLADQWFKKSEVLLNIFCDDCIKKFKLLDAKFAKV